LTPGYTLAAADGKALIYAALITLIGPVDATSIEGGFSVVVPEYQSTELRCPDWLL
jgi:hypothetical protein